MPLAACPESTSPSGSASESSATASMSLGVSNAPTRTLAEAAHSTGPATAADQTQALLASSDQNQEPEQSSGAEPAVDPKSFLDGSDYYFLTSDGGAYCAILGDGSSGNYSAGCQGKCLPRRNYLTARAAGRSFTAPVPG